MYQLTDILNADNKEEFKKDLTSDQSEIFLQSLYGIVDRGLLGGAGQNDWRSNGVYWRYTQIYGERQ